MYSKAIAYLKFLARSTNAHGVHSPFVFAYVTRCLYTAEKRAKDKATNVLLKSITYFKVKTLSLPDNPVIKKQVKQQYPGLARNSGCFDMICMNHLTSEMFDALLSEKKLHNNSVIFLTSIYQTLENRENWKALIASPHITVSLDLFHLGVVFLRKEQVKQHFTIRI